MFSVHCDTHGSTVLLTTRNIEALRNTDEGVVVAWRCRCGQRGEFLTGRPPLVPSRQVSAPAPADEAAA